LTLSPKFITLVLSLLIRPVGDAFSFFDVDLRLSFDFTDAKFGLEFLDGNT
jgi:hypothetical protein